MSPDGVKVTPERKVVQATICALKSQNDTAKSQNDTGPKPLFFRQAMSVVCRNGLGERMNLG